MRTSQGSISTNWHVITGASCAGKTTVINELEKLGMRVVQEPARVYIEKEMEKGRSLGQVVSTLLSDKKEFQQWVFSVKKEIEQRLPPNETIFLDRALPDSLGYFEFWGLDTNDIMQDCKKYKYKRVFLFDLLPLVHDGVRIEKNDGQRLLLEQCIEKNYRKLGYNVIRVPVLTVEARVELVMRASSP